MTTSNDTTTADAIVSAYGERRNMRAVAEQLGLPLRRVRDVIHRSGTTVEARRPHTFDEAGAQALHREFRAGATITELAKLYYCTRETVRRTLDRVTPSESASPPAE